MKKILLFALALLGVGSSDCYTYKIINTTSAQIGYDLFFVGDCGRLLSVVDAGKEVVESRYGSGWSVGCLITQIVVTSGTKNSSRNLRLPGGAGRTGNMTFLIFEKNDGTGPYIQWESGLVPAWDPCRPGKNQTNCKINK